MTGRRAPLAACLALAAELAAQWGIVPFGAPDVTTWSGLFASTTTGQPPGDGSRPGARTPGSPRRQDGRQRRRSRAPAGGWIGHEAREGPRSCRRSSASSSAGTDTNSTPCSRDGSSWAPCLPVARNGPPTSYPGGRPGTRHVICVSPRGHRPRTRGRPVTYTHHTLRYKLSLLENCVPPRKTNLTCGKTGTRHCVPRTSLAMIGTRCVPVAYHPTYHRFVSLACVNLDHLKGWYAGTQQRESHARLRCDTASRPRGRRWGGVPIAVTESAGPSQQRSEPEPR